MDVPGCGCPTSMCNFTSPIEYQYIDNPQACRFITPPDTFGITNNLTEPICDALLNSSAFETEFGPESLRRSRQSYQKSTLLPIKLRAGTCSESIEEERACMLDDVPSSFWGVGTVYDVLDGCGGLGYTLPTTNATVDITLTCKSWYDENITTGYDDELSIFIEKGRRGLANPVCEGKTTPVLTSHDWIETSPGRRYMCYDFDDNGEATYSIFFISLGNEPCNGPKPPPSSGGCIIQKQNVFAFLLVVSSLFMF